MCLWTSAGLEKRQVRFRATEKREREKPELGMMLSNNNIIIRQVCVQAERGGEERAQRKPAMK